MKTTIDIADPIYRQVKARAALRGTSMRAYITEAVRERLEREARRTGPAGWRAVFGSVPGEDVEEVQRHLDAEFETIRPEDWQ